MQKRPNIPQGLPMEQLMRLASSPEGQAILAQLQQNHAGELQSAIDNAKAGNYDQVKKTMSDFLSSPAGQALMMQLRGYSNG